jgi:hypothetical protein
LIAWLINNFHLIFLFVCFISYYPFIYGILIIDIFYFLNTKKNSEQGKAQARRGCGHHHDDSAERQGRISCRQEEEEGGPGNEGERQGREGGR